MLPLQRLLSLCLPIAVVPLACTDALLPRSACAQIARTAPTEARASNVIARAEKRLQSLHSLQAEWQKTETWEATRTSRAETRRQLLSAQMMKPLFWKVNSKRIPIPVGGKSADTPTQEHSDCSDGKTRTRLYSDRSFQQGKTLAGNFATWYLAPTRGFFVGGRSPLWEVKNRRALGDRVEVSYLGKQKWERQPYETVRIHFFASSQKRESTITLFIGADDLVHRWIEKSVADKNQPYTQEWVLRQVVLNPSFTASDFTVTMPLGYQEINESTLRVPLPVGSAAPDFTVFDTTGKPVRLSDYRGKVMVLDFWATWCPPCLASLPRINDMAKRIDSPDVIFLAVDVQDSQPFFRKWLVKHPELSSIHFALDTARGVQQIAFKYHVQAIPVQYVVGKDGMIAAHFVNADLDKPDFEEAIQKALAAH